MNKFIAASAMFFLNERLLERMIAFSGTYRIDTAVAAAERRALTRGRPILAAVAHFLLR